MRERLLKRCGLRRLDRWQYNLYSQAGFTRHKLLLQARRHMALPTCATVILGRTFCTAPGVSLAGEAIFTDLSVKFLRKILAGETFDALWDAGL